MPSPKEAALNMSFQNILEFRLRQKINVHVKYEIRVRIIDSNITQFIDRNIRLQNNKHNVITGWSDKACVMVFLFVFFYPNRGDEVDCYVISAFSFE